MKNENNNSNNSVRFVANPVTRFVANPITRLNEGQSFDESPPTGQIMQHFSSLKNRDSDWRSVGFSK